jgi:hypothetical protein
LRSPDTSQLHNYAGQRHTRNISYCTFNPDCFTLLRNGGLREGHRAERKNAYRNCDHTDTASNADHARRV